jgi:RNase P/RNase MRP subunit p29
MKGLREEYIGSAIEITGSKNKQLIGVVGFVLDETKNTILIRTADGKEKKILKKDTSFKIKGKTIEGNSIMKKPEDRVKIKPK